MVDVLGSSETESYFDSKLAALLSSFELAHKLSLASVDKSYGIHSPRN
jgi:hypothetical protein